MLTGEEYRYRGTNFIIECKEHINRVASPGSRNYIIRGLLSYGEDVEFPESVDGDPVTSFMPSSSFAEQIVYPGVKRLRLPGRLGRFLERNDIFPDLEKLEVDPDNQIFSTDGKMLYRDAGAELCLCLSAGLKDQAVTVPRQVKRLGASAFADSRCGEIIFENPWTEAEDTSFDRSEWIELQRPAAYVGNMLYRVTGNDGGGKLSVLLNYDTKRINSSAFGNLGTGDILNLCIPENMKFPGFSDAVISALQSTRSVSGLRGPELVTVSAESGKALKGKELPVPRSLDSSGRELLRKALDNDEDLFDEIFSMIGSRKEKLDYAIFASSGDEAASEDACRKMIADNQEEASIRALQILDEKALWRLMKRGYIGREALLKLLPDLQRRGMINTAAGILIMLNTGEIS